MVRQQVRLPSGVLLRTLSGCSVVMAHHRPMPCKMGYLKPGMTEQAVRDQQGPPKEERTEAGRRVLICKVDPDTSHGEPSGVAGGYLAADLFLMLAEPVFFARELSLLGTWQTWRLDFQDGRLVSKTRLDGTSEQVTQKEN